MFSSKRKHFVLARAIVRTETEEQQKLKTRRRHMAVYAVALHSDVCVPLMLVCLSDACVCTIHEHHAEARAALMRVASMND